MAAFNGEHYIVAQIKSILYTLSDIDELIVSDDSSTDKTIEEILSINDDRIVILEYNSFGDPIKNFQNALSHAKGDIVFLSDQDDIWLPNKVQRCIELLETYDLVVTDAKVVNENLDQINESLYDLINSGPGIVKNMIKSTYYGSCMAFKRNILAAAIPFPDTKEIGHDLWIGWVAEIIGKVYFLNETHVLYRRHQKTFTVTGKGKSKRSYLQMLRGRIIMISALIKFYLKYKGNA